MIQPTEADIGRIVVYRPFPLAKPEVGVITSMNRHAVFVRYAHQHPTARGQATSARDLEWEFDQ